MLFQSTLPTRGSDVSPFAKCSYNVVSIHAPHEGERRWLESCRDNSASFNPRSPRGGATLLHPRHRQPHLLFQSTLPTRGSDKCRKLTNHCTAVSIHAPHEGERRRRSCGAAQLKRFQSTLPTRGSDLIEMYYKVYYPVSIHAPHEGERRLFSKMLPIVVRVSIHAPHEGERPDSAYVVNAVQQFQSTLPTRGSDPLANAQRTISFCFNPRSPRGGATKSIYATFPMCVVSIHAPHEGERLECDYYSTGNISFNPRSPRGGATAEKCICMQHFREFTEYYPLRHGDACCIAPQDCIIQAFFGAKKRCFYVRLCFALKNKGVRG